MADRAISALPTATTLTASDLFVLSQGNQAKNTTWSVIIGYLTTALDGHGGIQSIVKTGASGLVDTYTVTLADETTYSFTVTNGKAVASITQYWAVSASNSVAPSTWYDTLQTMTAVNRYLWSKVKYTFNDASTLETTASVIGVYGDTGDAWYVHIKYASQEPTADADMGDVPDKWIGIYSGTSSTAPTSYTSYDWFQYKGDKGDTGDAAEILSQSVTYMEASSGTVIPSGSWTETIPPVTQGNFLWTRTILSFNDDSTVTSYSVARFGVDGTGSVASVNNVSPDGNGNVALAAANIPMSDNQSVQKHVADLGSEKADQIIISGVEESSTAANSYSVGQYLILSGALYRVTAAIAAGDTITDSGAGANVAAATVGGELTGLRNTLNQLDENMAYVESGNTASRPYTGGEFISWKGTLYTANGSISSGVSFSTGTGGNLDLVAGNNASGGGLNSLKDSLAEYSTTEKAVGKWINGKTLYRKVVYSENANSNDLYIPFGVSEWETIVFISCVAVFNDNSVRTVPTIDPQGYSFAGAASVVLQSKNSSYLPNYFIITSFPLDTEHSIKSAYVIVEYTKT